ncbi:MAG TPA: hypothetical protein ENJ00_07935 [Phycisphaerales bacterium]|nr:hypothetical protein [Phycisphaerales bacterium]
MTALLPTSRTVTLPDESLYWSVLDGASVSGLRAPAKERALHYALEPDLPLPIDEIHAVFHTNKDGTITACACTREQLDRLARVADVIVPAGVPGWINCEAPASAFNLLGGVLVSSRLRRTRRVQLMVLCVVFAALSGMLSIGFARRSEAYKHEQHELSAAIESAQRLILPPAGPHAQPASIRLAAMLRSISSETEPNAKTILPAATDPLRQILAIWPEGSRLKRLSIGKRDIRIDLTLPADHDPTGFIDGIEHLDGWRLSAPVLQRSPDETSLSLSLQRTEEAE